MTTINDFRTNFFNSAIKVSKETFLPISLIYIVVYILLAIVMGLVFFMGIGLTVSDFAAFSDPATMSNPDVMMAEYQNLALRMFSGGGFFIIFLGYMFVFMIMSWFYNFCYSYIHRHIKTNEVNIGHSFSESFSSKVPKLFLLMLLNGIIFIVVYFLLALVIGLFAMISPKLIFIGVIITFFGIMIFMMKMMLSTPILLISNKGVIDSIKDSYNAIDFKTCAIYSLYAIIGIIAIGIVLGIVLGIIVGGAFMIHEVLGGIFYVISIILTGGFLFTFFTTTILGLFYNHYYTEDSNDLELEENLIV